MDWTTDDSGRSNSSPLYCELRAEIARLIRDDAYKLLSGNAEATAGLILSQLAHVHGLAPTKEKTA
jgi:hypothetical protein